MANKAVEKRRWKQIDDRYPALRDGGLGTGAWWKPILSVLRQANSPGWGYEQKAALRSADAGRQWAQQRLKQAKLVEDGSCQLCLDLGGEPAAGTVLHRVVCPALRSFVEKTMPQWMRPHLRGPAEQWDPLVKFGLTRGLCPALNPLHRPESDYDTFSWFARPAASYGFGRDMPAGAKIFTDGSLLDGGWAGYHALGWAFVAINEYGEVLAAAYGVPPQWVDSIQGAELWAVHMALQTIDMPSALYTDCQTVQKGVRQGLQWAQGASRRYSRLWSDLHRDLCDGDQAEIVHWMPAHTSQEQVGELQCSDGTVLTDTMRCANAMVDHLAKQAAESIAMSPGARARVKKRFAQAKDLAIFVGQLTHEAGHCDRGDGKPCRDSVGMVVATAKRRKSRAKNVKAVPLSLEERSHTVANILQRIRSKWA